MALFLLLSFFLVLQSFLPLGTAIKIGADEDFELSKVTLVQKGYKLYTEVWNDQPPLYTFLLRHLTKNGSPNVLGPRLLTVLFSLILLSSFFLSVLLLSSSWSPSITQSSSDIAEQSCPPRHNRYPLITASLATLLLICSPGFIELSCSVMQEIPALAPIVASIAVVASIPLSDGRNQRWKTLSAGCLFGVGLQLKLIGIIYLPLIWLLFWAVSPRMVLSTQSGQLRASIRNLLMFGVAVFAAFIMLNVVTGSPLFVQLKQAWAAHFGAPQTAEYGSVQEHSFDWSVLAKNWDTTLPALFGLIVTLSSAFPSFSFPLATRTVNGRTRKRYEPEASSRGLPIAQQTLPVLWLALTLIIFASHKPWWAYYYVHNSLPLCWLAAIGILRIGQRLQLRQASKRPSDGGNLGVWNFDFKVIAILIVVAGWAGARLCLEERDIRALPSVRSSLLLKEVERFRPFAKFIFTDQPIYSFHADIAVPPHLAMLSLKRMWTGEMTRDRLVAELEDVKPELILWSNDTREVAFQHLLNNEYRMVYEDSANRLFAHKSISRKAHY